MAHGMGDNAAYVNVDVNKWATFKIIGGSKDILKLFS